MKNTYLPQIEMTTTEVFSSFKCSYCGICKPAVVRDEYGEIIHRLMYFHYETYDYPMIPVIKREIKVCDDCMEMLI